MTLSLRTARDAVLVELRDEMKEIKADVKELLRRVQ